MSWVRGRIEGVHRQRWTHAQLVLDLRQVVFRHIKNDCYRLELCEYGQRTVVARKDS